MWRALMRFFRTIKYGLTGRVDSTTDSMMADPNVIRATFDDVEWRKKGKIQEFINAVSGLVTQREKKKADIEKLSKEIDVLVQRKTGAGLKAKARAEQLVSEGKTQEEIQHDEEYLKCKGFFNDFTATLKVQVKRLEEMRQSLAPLDEKIKGRKLQLMELKRNVDQLKERRDTAITDVITAREEKAMADLEAGLSMDDGSEGDLARIEDMVQRTKASATVTSELAGTDTRVAMAEFDQYATSGLANDEFDALVGLKDMQPRENERSVSATADLDKELQ